MNANKQQTIYVYVYTVADPRSTTKSTVTFGGSGGGRGGGGGEREGV